MVKKEAVESGFVKWFSELTGKDGSIAGEKGARLAEMSRNKLPVPPGFVVTTGAYQNFIQSTGLGTTIGVLLARLDINDDKKLQETSDKIRNLIESAELPPGIIDEIAEAYDILGVGKNDEQVSGALDVLSSKTQPVVAVRASISKELSDESLTGQQQAFLGIKGDALIPAIKKCMSSLFTPKSLYALVKKQFSVSSGLAVVVQRMVNAEKSGVVFSGVPVKNKEAIAISAVFGISDGVVSSKIVPDKYTVHKEDILGVKISDKKSAAVRGNSGKIEEIKLKPEQSQEQVLSRYEIKRLAQYAMQLEEQYKEPQDIEFAITRNELYLVQSRPIGLRPIGVSDPAVDIPFKEEPEIPQERLVEENVVSVPKITNSAVSYGPKQTQTKTQGHLTAMEEEVLKALDDDYSPGVEKKEEIPALNDAIPVDSDHFN